MRVMRSCFFSCAAKDTESRRSPGSTSWTFARSRACAFLRDPRDPSIPECRPSHHHTSIELRTEKKRPLPYGAASFRFFRSSSLDIFSFNSFMRSSLPTKSLFNFSSSRLVFSSSAVLVPTRSSSFSFGARYFWSYRLRSARPRRVPMPKAKSPASSSRSRISCEVQPSGSDE